MYDARWKVGVCALRLVTRTVTCVDVVYATFDSVVAANTRNLCVGWVSLSSKHLVWMVPVEESIENSFKGNDVSASLIEYLINRIINYYENHHQNHTRITYKIIQTPQNQSKSITYETLIGDPLFGASSTSGRNSATGGGSSSCTEAVN